MEGRLSVPEEYKLSHRDRPSDLGSTYRSSNQLLFTDVSGLSQEIKSASPFQNNSSMVSLPSFKGFKKIMKLEASLKKKGEDYSKLKSNFEFLEDKLKNSERIFSITESINQILAAGC